MSYYSRNGMYEVRDSSGQVHLLTEREYQESQTGIRSLAMQSYPVGAYTGTTQPNGYNSGPFAYQHDNNNNGSSSAAHQHASMVHRGNPCSPELSRAERQYSDVVAECGSFNEQDDKGDPERAPKTPKRPAEYRAKRPSDRKIKERQEKREETREERLARKNKVAMDFHKTKAGENISNFDRSFK